VSLAFPSVTQRYLWQIRVYVTFIDKEGDEHKLAVNIGDNLLTVAQAHDIDMEGRFCGFYTRQGFTNWYSRSL